VWIVNNLGGIENVRFLHRVLACSLMAASVYHIAGISWTIIRGRFTPSMMPTLKDFVDALQMLRYSVGLTSKKPLFDRYNYAEKFEYWGIVYGAVIMIVTGLVLWFPTYVTRVLPGELVPAAKEMHSGEALLALLVILVWHLYSVMLSPTHFPLDTSIFTGKISKHKLMEEHPLEYMRLTGAPLEEVLAGERRSAEVSSQGNWSLPSEEEENLRGPPSGG
jgi:cytochrome b subunit of formate dehydrogenase